MTIKTNNLNIEKIDILTSPEDLKLDIPLTDKASELVAGTRQAISDILQGQDQRLMIICGPCSIHDIDSAKEYAKKLKTLADRYQDKFLILMRVYFEKPRTHIGWKGFINDPELNGSFNVKSGLRRARAFLAWLAELGLPAATEALDPISPQYLSDLISWAAIGARTTESQTHREMASGLSMPVGFKNGTDGSLDVATNALIAAKSAHSFMGIDSQGQVALIRTKGNPDAHIILRGGKKPNYQKEDIDELEQKLQSLQVNPKFIVDCSHGNSNKDYRNQPTVFHDILQQKQAGNQSIIGVMLESHLKEGNQPISASKDKLDYGVSITDACISWQTTETLLETAYQKSELN
ncbi:3-deoxy-7-phosphoheptulonate synthase [Kangiella sp. TOML190]|uniref:3-deoxy-7-phosphoheptulonate synthase n=1 Tax=Kangiella sp. TOML190 TaxID=2931351 RepID=UPI00203A908F|nr:3-deoxy-7-phosphoheptulonate synthase [Kangiella sp. TOML190]